MEITRRELMHIAVGSSLLMCPSVSLATPVPITNTKGYSIHPKFGDQAKKLIVKGLAVFYERFLAMSIAEDEKRAGVILADRFPVNDFPNATGDANSGRIPNTESYRYLGRQFARMRTALLSQVDFPRINFDYAYDAKGNWVARAPLNTMRIGYPPDFGKDWFTGEFRMEINDFYMNSSHLGRHYSDPIYWAGVMGHELLHNLGHRHPASRDDKEYYFNQMILVEMSIMNDGKAKYGDKNSVPVLCKPWA